MYLGTPARYDDIKRVHTPPSVGPDFGKSPPLKALRSFSGKFLRKSPTPPELHKVPTPLRFSSTQTPQKTPALKRRSHLPSELNLQSGVFDKDVKSVSSNTSEPVQFLASPIILSRPLNLSSRRLSISHNSNELILLQDEGGNDMLDLHSPLLQKEYRRSSHRTKRNITASHCVLCNEKPEFLFDGEKMVELECTHVCHYNCYLLEYETSFPANTFPRCGVCRETMKPVNDEILRQMTSKVLIGERLLDSKEPQMTIKGQWISMASAKDTEMIYTPMDQLIKSADITPNGLLTKPVTPCSKEAIIFSLEEEEEEGEIENEHDTPQNSVEGEVIKIPFHVSIEDGKTVAVRMLESEKIEGRRDKMALEEGGAVSKEILQEVLQILQRMIMTANTENKTPLENLLLFDKCACSKDMEDWSSNTLLALFDITLFLLDIKSGFKISGQIPLEKIGNVTRMAGSQKIMILDMKSSVFPEIYFKFEYEEFDNIYYRWETALLRSGKNNVEPLLESVTLNAWDLVPEQLSSKIQKVIAEQPRIQKISLDLLLCINLFCPEERIDAHRKEVVETITDTLKNLSTKSRLGLVLVGRNGEGTLTGFEYSKYIGMMSLDSWDRWSDLLESLVDPVALETLTEKNNTSPSYMMRGCMLALRRLVDMNGIDCDVPDRGPAVARCIIMVNNVATPLDTEYCCESLRTEFPAFEHRITQLRSVADEALQIQEQTQVLDLQIWPVSRHHVPADERLRFGNVQTEGVVRRALLVETIDFSTVKQRKWRCQWRTPAGELCQASFTTG